MRAQVIDCADWSVSEISHDKFFNLYGSMGCAGEGKPPAILKITSWPTRGRFQQRLPRHNQARSAQTIHAPSYRPVLSEGEAQRSSTSSSTWRAINMVRQGGRVRSAPVPHAILSSCNCL